MYVYKATVTKIIDGDTLDLMIDLGFYITHHVRVRLLHVDCPETFRPKSEDERARGYLAKEFTTNFLNSCMDKSGYVVVKTSKDSSPISSDKYGRWLVEIQDPSSGDYLHEGLISNNMIK